VPATYYAMASLGKKQALQALVAAD